MKHLLIVLLLAFPALALAAEVYNLVVDIGISEVKEGTERPKLAQSIGQYGDVQLELKKVEAKQADQGLGLPPPFGAREEYSAAFSRTTQKLKLPVRFQIRKFVESDPRIFRYELVTSLDGVVISNVGLRSLEPMMNVQSWGAPFDVDGVKYEPSVQVLFAQPPPRRE
jgi:hypothetical protein